MIEELLKSRGDVYGDYKGNSQCHIDLMNVIRRRYKETNDCELDPLLEVYIWNIVNKLSRIASTPDHVDSWKDIIGYATITIQEIENANK